MLGGKLREERMPVQLPSLAGFLTIGASVCVSCDASISQIAEKIELAGEHVIPGRGVGRLLTYAL